MLGRMLAVVVARMSCACGWDKLAVLGRAAAVETLAVLQ